MALQFQDGDSLASIRIKLNNAADQLNNAVPKTRTINGHDLNNDLTLTKADIGLDLVSNVPDVSKPVSTLQKAYVDSVAATAVSLVTTGTGNATLGVAPSANILNYNVSFPGTYPFYNNITVTADELNGNLVQFRMINGAYVKFLVPIPGYKAPIMSTAVVAGAQGLVRVVDTITNVIDAQNGASINYSKATAYYDGTAMTDAKVDNDLYIKIGAEYFIQALDLTKSRTLNIPTVASLRSISKKDFILYKLGYYQGLRLDGYYTKGDKAALRYVYTLGTFTDNGGSIIVPTGDTAGAWIAVFETAWTDVLHFGISPVATKVFNTAQLNTMLLLRLKCEFGNGTYNVSKITITDANIKGVYLRGKNEFRYADDNLNSTTINTGGDDFLDFNNGVNVKVVASKMMFKGNTGTTGYLFKHESTSIDFTMIFQTIDIRGFYAGVYSDSFGTGHILKDVGFSSNTWGFHVTRPSNFSNFENVDFLGNAVGLYAWGYQFSVNQSQIQMGTPLASPMTDGKLYGLYMLGRASMNNIYHEEYSGATLTPNNVFIGIQFVNGDDTTASVTLRHIDFPAANHACTHLNVVENRVGGEIAANSIIFETQSDRHLPSNATVAGGKLLQGVRVNGKNKYVTSKVCFINNKEFEINKIALGSELSNFLQATVGFSWYRITIPTSGILDYAKWPGANSTNASGFDTSYFTDELNVSGLQRPSGRVKASYAIKMNVATADVVYCLIYRGENTAKRIEFSKSVAIVGGGAQVKFQGEFVTTNVSHPYAPQFGFATDYTVPSSAEVAAAQTYLHFENLSI